MTNTDSETISNIITSLRTTFKSKITLPYLWRLKQLHRLRDLLHDPLLPEALYQDLHRSKFESHLLELNILHHEVDLAINHLDQWMGDKSRSTDLTNLPGQSFIKYDPLGTVLIMSPWNYPLLLTFQPLIGALAAGNTALLRPAHYSQHVSETIAKLVDQYFPVIRSGEFGIADSRVVGCVLGGREATQEILQHQFDFIFFTGGPSLGKIVLRQASEHLTPCVLELGGKSPAILHKSADLEVAVKRLVWATFLNSGQTCVRPDYLFVDVTIKDRVIELIIQYIKEFWSENRQQHENLEEFHEIAKTGGTRPDLLSYAAPNNEFSFLNKPISSNTQSSLKPQDLEIQQGIANSPYFSRVITDQAWQRLTDTITHDAPGALVWGGVAHQQSRFIAPTVLLFPSYDAFTKSAAMKEENFGPILPICTFNNINQVIDHINAHPKPLAAYCFCTDSQITDRIKVETSSGSLVLNDAVVHLTNADLPFGGVGLSGYGSYHGFASFETFSHKKSVMKKFYWADVYARYPPYHSIKRTIMSVVFNAQKVGMKINYLRMLLRTAFHDFSALTKLATILGLLAIAFGSGRIFILPIVMKWMKCAVESYYQIKL